MLRRTVLMLFAALLVVLPAGCSDDPVATDIAAYHAQITPLLVRNKQLAEKFMGLANAVRNEAAKADALARGIQEDIVPEADALKVDVAAIQPTTPQVAQLHARLVQAWAERADVYRAMVKAYRSSDPQGFDDARQRNIDAKLAEEAFFEEMSSFMRAYGYALDQFPG